MAMESIILFLRPALLETLVDSPRDIGKLFDYIF
jgi:hypothetical protein